MKHSISIQDLSVMALLTAFMCVASYIVIPIPFSPVSLTAQTFIINIIALLLPPRQAAFTILTYILLGLVGLPVFSGGSAGPAGLFGPTGGYIMSWLPAVVLISCLKGSKYSFGRCCAVTIFIGMSVIYFIGTLYMKLITGMNWVSAFSAAVIPFIPLDIFKCVSACMIIKPVRYSLKRAQW